MKLLKFLLAATFIVTFIILGIIKVNADDFPYDVTYCPTGLSWDSNSMCVFENEVDTTKANFRHRVWTPGYGEIIFILYCRDNMPNRTCSGSFSYGGIEHEVTHPNMKYISEEHYL